MKEVALKNGSTELSPVVAMVMRHLDALMSPEGKGGMQGMADAMAFYELHSLCVDPAHEVFSEPLLDRLKELSLVEQGGSVNRSIKNIVLSASVGKGLGLSLQSPIKGV